LPYCQHLFKPVSIKACRDSGYFRPLKRFKITTTRAMMRRIWINPPIVYDVTNPNNQNAIRITASVHSISNLLFKNGSALA
jgi:hypothetical protein